MTPTRPDEPVAGDPLFGIVGVAASAGGLNALSVVLGSLPADLPVPVVVVQHLDPRHRSLMADLLDRRTGLVVREAAEDEKLEPGNVWIAPPNRHLLIRAGGTLALSDSERVHFVRPSADLLFESMAGAYGDRAVA
ncbi:MAG TPA: chemotaxis protein CheB, partial [Acidimicrobiales bacterium]|nr:chemotaxis protein CheB [Acidimicrobiales bacterium]